MCVALYTSETQTITDFRPNEWNPQILLRAKDNTKDHAPKLLLETRSSESDQCAKKKALFHMVMPGISDQGEGHKIIAFAYFYNSNNIRVYFGVVGVSSVMWATTKATRLEGENYWTEENICWNILTEKMLASLWAVSLVIRPVNQKNPWNVQVHPGYLETRDVLRYHR